MIKKKLVLLVLAICMVMSLKPTIVFAGSGNLPNGEDEDLETVPVDSYDSETNIVKSGPSINVTVVDRSVDNSSICVELFVIFRNGETGETAEPINIDTIRPENVTVSTFETVKSTAIEEAKRTLNGWLEMMRQMNPDVQFTVVGDMAEAGDKVVFDNRIYSMQDNGSGSGTTSSYMLVEGDYGYRGSYTVTMTVEVPNTATVHTHNLTLVPAKDSTCTEAGSKAYYTCDGCDKWFEDAIGAVEITDHGSVVLPAKGHSYGDDNVCDICGYAKPVTPPSYSIIEGANSSWTENTDGTLTFRADGDFNKFTGVKIDDVLIDAKNYTAVSGSTIVTLKADYLKTLSVGTHKLAVVFNDGECSTNFEVKKQATNQTTQAPATTAATTESGTPADASPATGDDINIGMLLALLVLSGMGMLAFISRDKKMDR